MAISTTVQRVSASYLLTILGSLFLRCSTLHSVDYESTPGYDLFTMDATFQSFSDHIITKSSLPTFDPSLIKLGDVVFIEDGVLDKFIQQVHPSIADTYILISNDSDMIHPSNGTWQSYEREELPLYIPTIRTLLYDTKIGAWFAKNLILSRHPKLIQIPIGPNIRLWKQDRTAFLNLLNLREDHCKKKRNVYINMDSKANYCRPVIIRNLKSKPFCTYDCDPLPPNLFYQKMKESSFVISPPSQGLDTVRFWVAQLLDCIPIVQHSELDDLYSLAKVLFVHDWKEINEKLLKQTKERFQSFISPMDPLSPEAWMKKIETIQAQIRDRSYKAHTIAQTAFPSSTLYELIAVINQHSKVSSAVLIKGALLGIRPFELAKLLARAKTIFTFDPFGAWNNERAADPITPFETHPLFRWQERVIPITNYNPPYLSLVNAGVSQFHLILDLTYRRYPLWTELEEALDYIAPGHVLCGNLVEDPYVSEIITRFSRAKKLPLTRLGKVWYFVKPEKRQR